MLSEIKQTNLAAIFFFFYSMREGEGKLRKGGISNGFGLSVVVMRHFIKEILKAPPYLVIEFSVNYIIQSLEKLIYLTIIPRAHVGYELLDSGVWM